MSSFMRSEIEAQPKIFLEKVDYWMESAKRIDPLLKSRKNIVLLGRGSSGNACTFASYIFGLATGRHPIDFRPWLTTQDIPHASYDDCVVLSYTQSGESTDIIHATEWLKNRGAKIIGITNAKSKTPSIAKFCDELFFLEAGDELAVPATKTFSIQLLVTAALAGINIKEKIAEISQCLTTYLTSSHPLVLRDFIDNKNVVLWLARGVSQCSALDSALKLQETVNFASFGYSSAEFLHGPIGSTKKDDAIILFDSSNSDKENDISKITKILEHRQIAYKVISNKQKDPNYLKIDLPNEKWAKAIVFSFIGQYNALLLSEKRGLNPDKPDSLNKITFT